MPNSACRRGHPAVMDEQGGTGPLRALFLQGEKGHQLQRDLPLPTWDQFNIYGHAAPSRIYQQFRHRDVSCVPQHKHKLFSLLSQISPQSGCWIGTY